MNVLTKFKVLSFIVPEIIKGTRKNWAVPEALLDDGLCGDILPH